MNTYQENLKSTAIATLSALAAEQDRLDSAQTAAHYRLYYAQGAQLTALDKAGQTKGALKSASTINCACLADDNAAVNLLATATTGGAIVATSNANMAAAASSVQIASSAIAQLAAEIGAAFNNATASLYDSNVYKRIEDANKLINEVANDSMKLSEKSMMASIDTSEIISVAVLTQATGFKAKVDMLLEATQAEFGKYKDLFVAEKAAVGTTSMIERQAEGAVMNADSAAQAIAAASNNANKQLNMGLAATVVSVNTMLPRPTCTLSVAFLELLAPEFSASASDVFIPAIVAADPPAQPGACDVPGPFNYFVLLALESRRATLTTELAQQLFAVQTTRTDRFAGLKPSDRPQVVTFDEDVYQDAIVPGQPYVAFLFAVLSDEYKFFTNNYSDWLSAPSPRFTVADTLPTAGNIRAQPTQGNPDKPLSVRFDAAPKPITDGTTLEYRCILVEEDANDFDLQLMRKGPSPIFFDVDIARQVAPANYEKTDAAPDVAAGAGAALDGSGAALGYTIDFNAWSTDNFGNLLRPGATYRPYILATASGPNAAAYVSTLAYGNIVQLPAA